MASGIDRTRLKWWARGLAGGCIRIRCEGGWKGEGKVRGDGCAGLLGGCCSNEGLDATLRDGMGYVARCCIGCGRTAVDVYFVAASTLIN